MIGNLKKGDKVLFVSNPYSANGCEWLYLLNKYLGKVVTIKRVNCMFNLERYETYEENEIVFLKTDFVKKIKIGE